MSSWEKKCIMAFAVIMLFLFVFGILQIIKHSCDNPYERVCVESHTVMSPVITSKGIVNGIYTVCDKYETRIKEKCKR